MKLTITNAQLSAARAALTALDKAASGDSNDREIECGREVADILAGMIGHEAEDWSEQ